jgi:hypothetical protein
MASFTTIGSWLRALWPRTRVGELRVFRASIGPPWDRGLSGPALFDARQRGERPVCPPGPKDGLPGCAGRSGGRGPDASRCRCRYRTGWWEPPVTTPAALARPGPPPRRQVRAPPPTTSATAGTTYMLNNSGRRASPPSRDRRSRDQPARTDRAVGTGRGTPESGYRPRDLRADGVTVAARSSYRGGDQGMGPGSGGIGGSGPGAGIGLGGGPGIGPGSGGGGSGTGGIGKSGSGGSVSWGAGATMVGLCIFSPQSSVVGRCP